MPNDYELSQAVLNGWMSESGLDVTRAATEAKDYKHYGLSSYVLLAACKATEQAREYDSRGLFTTALLKVLRGVDRSSLTYKDLISKIEDIEK
jgi:hypothetical protein